MLWGIVDNIVFRLKTSEIAYKILNNPVHGLLNRVCHKIAKNVAKSKQLWLDE